MITRDMSKGFNCINFMIQTPNPFFNVSRFSEGMKTHKGHQIGVSRNVFKLPRVISCGDFLQIVFGPTNALAQ